jgi:aspartate aminotransferase
MTHLTLSRRVSALKPSVTVAVTNRAKQMKRDGIDVLAFAAGEPDFDTPEPIKAAAVEALWSRADQVHADAGRPRDPWGDRREAPARERDRRAHREPRRDHGAGGKHALYTAMHCLLDAPEPGEEPWEVLFPCRRG